MRTITQERELIKKKKERKERENGNQGSREKWMKKTSLRAKYHQNHVFFKNRESIRQHSKGLLCSNNLPNPYVFSFTFCFFFVFSLN